MASSPSPRICLLQLINGNLSGRPPCLTTHFRTDQGDETDDDLGLPGARLPDAQPDLHSPGTRRIRGSGLDNPSVRNAPVCWWAGRSCGPSGAGPDLLSAGCRGPRPGFHVGRRDAEPPAVVPRDSENGGRDGTSFGKRTGTAPDLPGRGVRASPSSSRMWRTTPACPLWHEFRGYRNVVPFSRWSTV